MQCSCITSWDHFHGRPTSWTNRCKMAPAAFSGWTWSTKWNSPFHFTLFLAVTSSTTIYWSKESQLTNLLKWNGKFRSDRSDWSKWATFQGGPESCGRTEPKRTFSIKFRPKFRNFFLVIGKHYSYILQTKKLIFVFFYRLWVCWHRKQFHCSISLVIMRQHPYVQLICNLI